MDHKSQTESTDLQYVTGWRLWFYVSPVLVLTPTEKGRVKKVKYITVRYIRNRNLGNRVVK